MAETEPNTESKREYRSSGLIFLQDCSLSLVTSFLAILIARWLAEPIAGFEFKVLYWLLASLVGTIVGSLISGSHRLISRWVKFRSSVRLTQAIAIKETVMIVAVVTRLVWMPSLALDILMILSDLLLTTLALFYSRFVAVIFTRNERDVIRQDASKRNTLVSGTDAAAVAMAEEIRNSKEFNLIGFITQDKNMNGRVIDGLVVFYCKSEDDYNSLKWKLGGIDCILFPKKDTDDNAPKTEEHPQEIVENGISKIDKGIKRCFDFSLSAILLVIFSPLALVSALAIKLDDGKDVLYKQERIGKNGKPFTILKFRTMKMNAEANGAQLFQGDKDNRLTKAGAFLRKYHLDELPQLWNVFRGDMSFVGYRPERRVFIDKIMEINPRYRYLYQIRPGVTSYATLYNGYTDTLEKMLTRLDLDLYYVRNHSLGFDAKILGLTFLSIVSGRRF